ncbi:MAG: AAA family ATPase [Chloroflexi bacterium]|nr:AAA family ATPase [Chloroflexota bacterium]
MMNDAYGIVLVDEAQEDRLRLRKEVSAAGISVVGEASSTQEAVTLAHEAQPDAMVISVEEPLARALRTIEMLATALSETPIIAVSSEHSREILRKAVLAGARDVLSRPLRKDELVETLAVVVKRREQRGWTEGNGAPLPQGTVVSVFGPKGGVGKTTLAINLGVHLATQSKERVIVVDLDTQVGAAAVMLNLLPNRTIVDVLQNMRHVDRDVLKSFVVEHASGLALLPAPIWTTEQEEELPADDVGRLLGLLSSYYDYVIIDTPPRLDAVVLRSLQASTFILLMTSLEVASLHATKRVLERIGKWEFAKDKIKVVTNVSNSANSLGQRDIEAALGYEVFWSLPHDPNVAIASQVGQPVVQAYPRSKASQSISQLHYTLIGAQPARSGGLGTLLRGWKS